MPAHLKRDCRKVKRASEQQGGTVCAALASTSSAAAAAKVEGSWWTLDSGCTDHMTGDATHLCK
jgi:hypothetical protein